MWWLLLVLVVGGLVGEVVRRRRAEVVRRRRAEERRVAEEAEARKREAEEARVREEEERPVYNYYLNNTFKEVFGDDDLSGWR